MADDSSPAPITAQHTEPLLPKTSDFYRVTEHLPAKFNHPDQWLPGYRSKATNPLYRTSNQTYGSRPPTVHEMPTSFNAISDKFSEKAIKCGMYRNNSLNTFSDKCYVTGPDNLITYYDRLNFHKSYNTKGGSE
ncbi:piercer of microtubule wall 1 protein [Bombina bombina]|uniref:piercer of microtubule wall 1 protein n=1 Tax=Bombina bombina TaxID=8345 RepID=UPI00235A6730|nr:piercer of microtubule wall 1 protein [Bombina bombina]